MQMKVFKRLRTAQGVNRNADQSLVKLVNDDVRIAYRPGNRLLLVCKGDFYGIGTLDVGQAIHLAVECLQYAEAEDDTESLVLSAEIQQLSCLLAERWPQSSEALAHRIG